MHPELAIIVPTFNEAGNVAELFRRLDACLKNVRFEAIFVDDGSADGTREAIAQLASMDTRVRLIARVGRRGLASACVEGMMASFAPICAVIDADLQHDESLLPQMLKKLRGAEADIVIGSRFMKREGDAGVSREALSLARQTLSRLGNRLARLVTKTDLTDPLSGFFMLRRRVIEEAAPHLSSKGYKILVDIFASMPEPLRVAELPYAFRPRHSGESKLEPIVLSEYLFLLADKTIGRFLPIRFVLFVTVGMVGVLVHLCVLGFGIYGLKLPFANSQILALLAAMTANFIGNNCFTYRDARLKGQAFWLGLASFYLACSFGAVINVQIAEELYKAGALWQFAGIAGAIVGAVWNYGVTATFTWKAK